MHQKNRATAVYLPFIVLRFLPKVEHFSMIRVEGIELSGVDFPNGATVTSAEALPVTLC
jgi:hypothetical protein